MEDQVPQDAQQFTIDIASILPRVTKEVAEELRKKALDSFSYTATEIMKREITAYLMREIVPKLADELKAKEAELKAGLLTALFQSMNMLNEKVVEHARKRLSGYEGDALVRSLTECIFGRQAEATI